MDHIRLMHKLLSENRVVNNKVYTELINVLPPGLFCKLRLLPDYSLGHKLSHLLTVCGIAVKSIDLGYEYEVLDVENTMKSEFMFDADVVIMKKEKIVEKEKEIEKIVEKNAVCIIDCTASQALYVEKMKKLMEIKRENPSVDEVLVFLFEPIQFLVKIEKPEQLKGFSSEIFDLFDNLAQSSLTTRSRFLKCCEQVYDKVNMELMAAEYSDLNERYEAWDLEPTIMEIAVELVNNHSLRDVRNFDHISNNNSSRVYYDTFLQILSQRQKEIKPCMHLPAAINVHNDLLSVLNALSGNKIAACLAAAMRNSKTWYGITDDFDLQVNPKVIGLKGAKAIIPSGSKYFVIAQHIEGHIFEIKFSLSAIDDNFKEQILGNMKSTNRLPCGELNVEHEMKQINDDYRSYFDEWFSPSHGSVNNTIIGKISTMADHYAKEGAMATRASSNLLNSVATRMASYAISDILNHDYEIAKTFTASLKCSPKRDYYYVGVNGPFESVTLTRMSATQDSFTTSSYFVIYRTVKEPNMKSVREIFREKNLIVQSKTRTFNRNTLAHALKLPMTVFSLLTWEIENIHDASLELSTALIQRIMLNSVLHVSVNNDQFSQCAEQLRYLFTSNVGVGAKAESICEKMKFIRPRTMWEMIYIFRMLKLAAGLNVLYKTKQLGRIIRSGEFNICLPSSVIPITSFSHLISSMYYANIYNKFRAFHEVSEAICYNELEEEESIYQNACSERSSEVLGISPATMRRLRDLLSVDYDEILDNEVEFCKMLLLTGPNRFKMSIFYIIGGTSTLVSSSKANIDSMYRVLSSSPIEACTMHGAMESGVAKREHQGVRAASAILEELIEEMGLSPAKINREELGFLDLRNSLSRKDFDFSIMTAVARQMEHKGDYSYRVVQKDQKGHREISVLNAKFRLGALFAEKVSHELSQLVPGDVLDNSNKDVIVENSVRKLVSDKSVKFILSDNSDQKRWGPNHLLHSFSAMMFSLLRDDMGLFRMINTVFQYGENKRAKFPETLTDLGLATKFMSRSEPIGKFFENHKTDMIRGCFDKTFEWGMCQGIFHRTSSLYHGIMCLMVNDIASKSESIPKHNVYSYVTSDDAERIFAFKENVQERIQVCKNLHHLILNVGSLTNILRNESKSVFSSHITEFNSIFYHHGVLATPTLKQRISKLDIGDGHDHILDYITATSQAMGYFQNGGSYMGSVIITILNYVMHTEQWRRWTVFSKSKQNMPVEFGGFPVIEPLSTMICGPISNMFLKASRKCDPDTYAHMITESTLTPAMPIDMNETLRTKANAKILSGHYVLKAAGPLGFVSMARTDRRLSQFERRHKMSHWTLPDSYITLNKFESSGKKFLFNLMRMTKTCEFETKVGINSFYIRMSDPWLNRDREILRVHKNHVVSKRLTAKLGDKKVSFAEIETAMFSETEESVTQFFDELKVAAAPDIKHNEIRVRLGMLLTDSRDMFNTLNSVEDVKYQQVKNKNSIVKINLLATVSLDENEFHYSLLKSVIGEPIKTALIEKTRNPHIWDRIVEIENFKRMSPVEGIYFCANIIQAYEKFVRRSTKLICPGEEKPNTLPDLLEKILSFKFTEAAGIGNIKFRSLASTSAPPFAFFTHNKALLNYTNKFWERKEENIRPDYMEIDEKVGIESDYDMITHSDIFNVDPAITEKKRVLVDTKGKFNFIQRMKLWSSANVSIMLSDNTLQSLLNNELTNHHEYARSITHFSKNQTRIIASVKASNIQCFELQTCEPLNGRTVYRHNFLFRGTLPFIIAEAEFMKNDESRKWATTLVEFINKKRRFRTDQIYDIEDKWGNVTDQVRFLSINSSMLFELVTYPVNLTIFLKHIESGVEIPVCSQQNSKKLNVDLKFNYTDNDFDSAIRLFKFISDETDNFTEVPPELGTAMSFLLFRSSAYTDVSYFNDLLSKTELDDSLPTSESADLLRSFIMCNIAQEIKCNRTRIRHHFLNLFRSSAFYNNGVLGVKFDSGTLDDAEMEDEIMQEVDDDDVDLNIPDKPMWTLHDKDDLFTALEDIVEEKESKRAASSIAAPVFEDSDDDEEDPFAALNEDEEMAEATKKDIFAVSDTDEDGDSLMTLFAGDVTNAPRIKSIIKVGEIADSHIVNTHFEDCSVLIEWMRKYSEEVMHDKAPAGYYQKGKTFTDTIRIFSTGCQLSRRKPASKIIKAMYDKKKFPFNSLRVPISALCVNELAFF